ncbi:preprotein translocase subunit YajC [Pseudonocardia sichuanensis]
MDISLLFPLLILLLFIPIFLSGRRQKRQMQEMKDLQASLEPGDVVMTTSGLRGTVVDASYEDTIDLEVADGVVTTWVRGAVREKVALPAGDDTTAVEAPAEPETSQTATPSLDKGPSLEKDDSANGTPRT